MMMSHSIEIRKFQPADEPAIEEITYRTGFKGEDLTGRGVFEDRRLWFMIFIGYYTKVEPSHCFVAVDNCDDTVIGFICGTPDTQQQQTMFARNMLPRLLMRAIFFTSWRYSRSFITLMKMWKSYASADLVEEDEITRAYPAHLHINVLDGYQGAGVGTRLMQQFEGHMQSLGVTGIHLGTTSKNLKAVPFYKKMGFEVVQRSGIASSPYFDDLRYLTFAKKLRRGEP